MGSHVGIELVGTKSLNISIIRAYTVCYSRRFPKVPSNSHKPNSSRHECFIMDKRLSIIHSLKPRIPLSFVVYFLYCEKCDSCGVFAKASPLPPHISSRL